MCRSNIDVRNKFSHWHTVNKNNTAAAYRNQNNHRYMHVFEGLKRKGREEKRSEVIDHADSLNFAYFNTVHYRKYKC